jgi:glycosyltransferase involved in cell wall biosynthesis
MIRLDDHKGSLLFVSIDFPPARTSGIYRPVFFTRYLIEAGWKVTLMTATSHLSTVMDESLYKEIHPELDIVRASAPMPRAITGKFYQRYQKATETADATAEPSLKVRLFALLKKLILSPVFRLIDNFLLIPDNYIIWAMKNLFKAYRIIKNQNVTHLLVTSPPQSVQVMGLILSYLTGARYITDFRNSWTDNLPYEYRIREKIEKSLERRVLKRSKAVINMSAGDVDRLLARMPDFPLAKLHVVTNGYNERDFAECPDTPAEADGPLRLLYVGTMYAHSGDSTAQALKILSEQGYTAADVQLTVIGFADQSFEQLVNEYGVRSLVANLGFLNHDDLIKAYHRYDVMYLLTGGTAYYHRGALPGKIFEYMRLGQPILHAGIDGTTHDMLKPSGLEIFTPLDDASGIAARIAELVKQKRSSALAAAPNRAYIESFEWRRLAHAVDVIISGVK